MALKEDRRVTRRLKPREIQAKSVRGLKTMVENYANGVSPMSTYGNVTGLRGSGTVDRTARWSSTNELITGVFLDNGTNVAYGRSSSFLGKFHYQTGAVTAEIFQTNTYLEQSTSGRALHARSYGAEAGYFQNTQSSWGGSTLRAESSGTSTASSAVYAKHLGSGSCFYGDAQGGGYILAGFRNNHASGLPNVPAVYLNTGNGTDTRDAIYSYNYGSGSNLHCVTAGSGRAARFVAETSGTTGSLVEMESSGGTRTLYVKHTGSGKAIDSEYTGISGSAAYLANTNASSTNYALGVRNAGSGAAVDILASGNGMALYATVTATGSTTSAATISHAGNGTALYVTATGARALHVSRNTSSSSVSVAEFENAHASDTNSTLKASKAGGTGHTAAFHLTAATSTHGAVLAQSDGTGDGLYAKNTSTGVALRIMCDGATNTTNALLVTHQYNGNAAVFQTTATTTGNTKETVHIKSAGNGGCLDLTYSGGATASGTAAWLLRGYNGTTRVARISRTGAFYGASFNTTGADFAEYMTSTGAGLTPGSVCSVSTSLDRSVMQTTTANELIAGVISTAPGFRGAPFDLGNDPASLGYKEVAMVGIVPVKVNTSGGAIARGDRLVSSATPGVAMRAPADPATGTVIGYALQAHAAGSGTIEVLLRIH